MATVDDLATAFVIRELTGSEREVRLTGRALPYRPFELSGKQRSDIAWYPGSPIATLQVLGASEEPTTIRGVWKDKFLGGDIPVGQQASLSTATQEFLEGVEVIVVSDERIRTAREICRIIDDIRRQGQEVEVTWLDQVRRGILDRFTQRWLTGHDVEWEIQFSWISQGESFAEIESQDAALDLWDVPSMIQDGVDEVGLDPLGTPDWLSRTGDRFANVASEINQLAVRLQEGADDLASATSQSIALVTAPFEAARRVAGALDSVKLTAGQVYDTLQSAGDSIVFNAAYDFGVALALRLSVRVQSRAAAGVRDTAAAQQRRVLDRMGNELVAVFQATEGQDLREISFEAYGTPDEWRALMIYNRFTSSLLVAGQVVFVPAQPPQGGC